MRKPYTEVTMNDILKASGLSKGGFYHHFKSKEELYKEVIDHFVLKIFLTEYNHFADSYDNLSFADIIPFYVKSTLEHLIDFKDRKLNEFNLNVEEVNLYMVMFDMMKHYKGFEKIVSKIHDSEVGLFKVLIDKAKTNGDIRKDIDSLALANHVHTLMHGIGVLAMFEPGMENLESTIKEQFNNLYKLIKT